MYKKMFYNIVLNDNLILNVLTCIEIKISAM